MSILVILLFSALSTSCCIGDDDNNGDDDENGNGDGNGNGNGNNNNNTTNNSSEITFLEIHHDPETPTPNEYMHFIVKIQSDNPILKVEITVCSESSGLCYAPFTLKEMPPNSNSWESEPDWQVPNTPGDTLKYHVTAKDSLENTKESDEFQVTVNE